MTAEAAKVRARPGEMKPYGQAGVSLVLRARDGDKQAWDALVERYAPLIWSICRRNRLSRADANDVGQRAWMQLVDRIAAGHDPAAIPGWFADTIQQECGRSGAPLTRRMLPGRYRTPRTSPAGGPR